MRVLVLAGGRSAERDVSLASGAAVSAALENAGFEVMVFDPGVSEHAIPWTNGALDTAISKTPPAEPSGRGLVTVHNVLTPEELERAHLGNVDVVFNAMHGGAGEDGHVQALLDTAGVAYAGSGMLASALAMDKNMAKRIFTAEGIPTPNWWVVRRDDDVPFADARDAMGLPFIVKPNAQGSTVGLSLVKDAGDWQKAIDEAFRWDDMILIEEFIDGREVSVGILGNETLPIVEIKPSHAIYDYECKYTTGKTEYICPAELPPQKVREIREQGLAAFQALGCSGYGRVDFRIDQKGHVFCLEVNTLPGMTSTSLVPKAAEARGIDFPELVRRICELALANRPNAASRADTVLA